MMYSFFLENLEHKMFSFIFLIIFIKMAMA